MHVSFGMAELYKGVCFLRFDDTNPEAEKQEYIDHIEDIVSWLGWKPYKVILTVHLRHLTACLIAPIGQSTIMLVYIASCCLLCGLALLPGRISFLTTCGKLLRGQGDTYAKIDQTKHTVDTDSPFPITCRSGKLHYV